MPNQSSVSANVSIFLCRLCAVVNGVIFRQLRDEPSNTYTFLVACPQTSEAILIDPVYEQVRAVGPALLPSAQGLCCWDKGRRSCHTGKGCTHH